MNSKLIILISALFLITSTSFAQNKNDWDNVIKELPSDPSGGMAKKYLEEIKSSAPTNSKLSISEENDSCYKLEGKVITDQMNFTTRPEVSGDVIRGKKFYTDYQNLMQEGYAQLRECYLKNPASLEARRMRYKALQNAIQKTSDGLKVSLGEAKQKEFDENQFSEYLLFNPRPKDECNQFVDEGGRINEKVKACDDAHPALRNWTKACVELAKWAYPIIQRCGCLTEKCEEFL